MLLDTVTFGGNHDARIAELLGEAITYETRVIETCCYVKPNYTVYLLSDGRVAKLVEQAFSHVVYVFADTTEYSRQNRAYWGSFPDPETR